MPANPETRTIRRELTAETHGNTPMVNAFNQNCWKASCQVIPGAFQLPSVKEREEKSDSLAGDSNSIAI